MKKKVCAWSIMYLILCSLLSIWFAIYGVYTFTSAYTCWIVKWNNSLKKTCQNFFWIPSALVVALVLGILVYKNSMMGGGYSGGYSSGGY
jgi:H+/Cl- antiporter ClcA